MKKYFPIMVLFFIAINGVYSQSWTVEGVYGTEEYTILTKEQFDRIVNAQETIAIAASFSFVDAAEINRNVNNARVIRGTRPNLTGYYYMTVRPIPNDPNVNSIVIYGNSRTGRMIICFYSALFPGTISLRFNWNEYARQYNQLLRLVNNE